MLNRVSPLDSPLPSLSVIGQNPHTRTTASPSSCARNSNNVVMSSTLVETVNLNFEDFSESFLTCSTCLCPYDSADHNPKLLCCSHTVCQSCLHRIADLPQSRNTGSFRCPICRETVPVPRGGISALPPSFIVNQLRDLMQRQRREVVPKCTVHPAEELLFCETCDVVFCPQCLDPVHSDPAGSCDHTVVPFSIAIKRMSEIVLYKANHCTRNLNRAADNVMLELEKLDQNVDAVLDQVSQSSQALALHLDRRRQEIVAEVRQIRDEKRRILHEQLSIIQTEKARVEQDCTGIEYQVEVRHLSRKISELSQKLDVSNTLVEPRENAYLRYCHDPAAVIAAIQGALCHLGSIEVSKTFPPLCTAAVEPAVANLKCRVVVTTIDYNGCQRSTGSDPIEATMHKIEPPPPPTTLSSSSSSNSIVSASSVRHSLLSTCSAQQENNNGSLKQVEVSVHVQDNADGTYELSYTPIDAGRYVMDVRIFGRPIKGGPITIQVSPHNNPIWQLGTSSSTSGSSEQASLCQPVKLLSAPLGELVILDTGNNRIKICSSDGKLLRHVTGDSLSGQSVTGLTFSRLTNTLFVLNWRQKNVSEWTLDGPQVQSFRCAQFAEPIDLVADDKNRRLLVLDNSEGGSVLALDVRTSEFQGLLFHLRQSTTKTIKQLASQQQQQHTAGARGRNSNATAALTTHYDLTCIAMGLDDDILVGGTFGCHVYSSQGRFIRRIEVCASPPLLSFSRSSGSNVSSEADANSCSFLGIVGGIVVDKEGFVLMTLTGCGNSNGGNSMAQNRRASGVFSSQVSVSHYKGCFLYAIDSDTAKLKRPCGVALAGEEAQLLVADLGNNCVKKYRYK